MSVGQRWLALGGVALLLVGIAVGRLPRLPRMPRLSLLSLLSSLSRMQSSAFVARRISPCSVGGRHCERSNEECGARGDESQL